MKYQWLANRSLGAQRVRMILMITITPKLHQEDPSLRAQDSSGLEGLGGLKGLGGSKSLQLLQSYTKRIRSLKVSLP